MIQQRQFWRLIRLIPIMLLALAACQQASQPGTVLIVRHAERASDAPNTDLDPDDDGIGIGVSRAQALAELSANNGVEAVYTTQYCRTAQTGQPTAVALDLTLNVMQTTEPNAGLDDCDPSITVPTQQLPEAINTTADLAQHIAKVHSGEVVLVVGHSNTVPELIEALGAPPLCPTLFPLSTGCWIPVDEYNHLFEVTVPTDGGTASVNHQFYGAR